MSEEGYFSDRNNLEKLKAEILKWKNTPYRHWTGVLGKGVDCIHYIVRVYEAAGATKGRYINIPKYSPDWHLHNGRKLLVEGIKAQLDCMEVNPKDPENGDLILYRFGLHEAHGGLFLNGDVHQALTDIGVQSRRYEDESFYHRMKRAFRIKL
jgi:cell wall-associated NlpC family hydrolase